MGKGSVMKDAKAINMATNAVLIDAGCVLETHHGIRSFKLLGSLYTTNKRRINRGKGAYKFDDRSWKLTNEGLLYKTKMVLAGKAYKFD